MKNRKQLLFAFKSGVKLAETRFDVSLFSKY